VRVGAAVDGELRLMAVNARSAGLGRDGIVSLNLQLAPPSAASTGALAPAMPSQTVLGGNGLPTNLAPAAMPPTPPTVAPEPQTDIRGMSTS
jgi:general secretion pathway protein C